MAELPEGPYRIVDILPEQVGAERAARYFAVERFFLQPERLVPLRRRYAELLLRLNCYFAMAVSFDGCASWTEEPDPASFAAELAALPNGGFLRVLFPAQRAMIDLEADETWLTVYAPEGRLLRLLGELCAAEGLFLWPARQTGD